MIKFTHNNFLTIPAFDLTQWLVTIADSENYIIGKLVYNFVDADTMLSLNQEFLKHDTDTDILTFDYTEGDKIIAEVYISCPALLENARINNQSVERETLRLLSHALLHCFGFADKTEAEKKVMRAKEEDFINLFHVKH